jgi:hypothetical protein
VIASLQTTLQPARCPVEHVAVLCGSGALPGEVLERGSVLDRMAEFAARGGKCGRLVNVTPNVIARYARLLDDRARAKTWSR